MSKKPRIRRKGKVKVKAHTRRKPKLPVKPIKKWKRRKSKTGRNVLGY